MYKLLFILLLNCTPELIFLRFNLILEDEVVSALFNIASKNLIKISEWFYLLYLEHFDLERVVIRFRTIKLSIFHYLS